MVFADKIEDLCPHRNLRASAAIFWQRQGFATLLQWAVLKGDGEALQLPTGMQYICLQSSIIHTILQDCGLRYCLKNNVCGFTFILLSALHTNFGRELVVAFLRGA
jgi:hypothetical protein